LTRLKRFLVRTSRKVNRDASFFSSIYLRKQTPIIVFQMGKVGSTSVSQALEQSVDRCPVFHVHFLNPPRLVQLIDYYKSKGLQPPDHLYWGLRIHRHIIQRNHPARFITMLRDPIARNISSAFQNFELTTGVHYSGAAFARQELIEIMRVQGLDQYPLNWFDEEILTVLGIDVYAHPFPHEKGYLCYQNGAFELLLLKSESDDTTKEEAIASFLGLKDFHLSRVNVGENKNYADDYQFVKENLRFPADQIDLMYQSRLVTHFYIPEEIEKMKARWCAH
jgi:hypothetical protein